MIFVSRSELTKSLGVTSKVVSPKPIIPVMGNVKMEVNPTAIIISATNYEVGVVRSFPASSIGNSIC